MPPVGRPTRNLCPPLSRPLHFHYHTPSKATYHDSYQLPTPLNRKADIIYITRAPTDLSRALTISLRKPLLALVRMPRLHTVRSHDDIIAGIRRRVPFRRDGDTIPVHIVAKTLVGRRGPVLPRDGVRFRLYDPRRYRRHVQFVGPRWVSRRGPAEPVRNHPEEGSGRCERAGRDR